MSAQPVFLQTPNPSSAAAEPTQLCTPKLDAVVLDDAILRQAWKHFSLNVSDANLFEHRFDLPPARQLAFGLRSVPSERELEAATLSILLRFGNQSSFVAPLWHDGVRMRLNVPPAGLIMPVVRGGLVRAWLGYADAYDDSPKWVTSARFPLGCKARPSIHVVNPGYARDKGVAILTTHALEAEGIAGCGVVSVAGINGLRPDALALQLREEWPALRAVAVCTEEPVPTVVRALRMAGLKVTEGGDDE